MKRKLIYLIFLVPAILSACSSGGSDTASIFIDGSTPEESGTTEYVVEEPVVPDSVLTDSITTAEEALAFMQQSDSAERYARGILPQMATDNLDYARRLLKNRHNYFIVVDKPSMHVVLFDRFGVEKAAYKMACSKKYGTKHKRRDNRTPEGFFEAEGVYNSTEWLYTDDDGNTSQVKGQFGPRFIRLKTPVTSQVGIHGTCAPWALGSRASHGCIRIHNDSVMKLVTYVEPGTPIIVNPSERDQQVNREEGYDVPQINIGKAKHASGKPKAKEPEKTAEPAAKPEPDATETLDEPAEADEPDDTPYPELFD